MEDARARWGQPTRGCTWKQIGPSPTVHTHFFRGLVRRQNHDMLVVAAHHHAIWVVELMQQVSHNRCIVEVTHHQYVARAGATVLVWIVGFAVPW